MVEHKQKPRLHASWIDPHAKEIVRSLQRAGFMSYLVGGCVRDLLAGIHPKDFDIATSAEPNQVRKTIRGAYVIGKRFRLVLVKRGLQQYEVATFRREATAEDLAEATEAAAAELAKKEPESENSTEPVEPVRIGDNFFGTPEEDAVRRDFTINALFYDPIKDDLIDYVKGMADIESRTLRMIGEPKRRIQEDPIRSLRAIRLAHKLGFQIEENLRSAMLESANELAKSIMPRRREEYLKFLKLENPLPALAELQDLGLMSILLPTLSKIFESPETHNTLIDYMVRFDEICQDKSKTTELYLPLVLAVHRALEGFEDREIVLNQFLKDELGVFKAEQLQIMAAIEGAEKFPDLHSFMKRGNRRQAAFFRQDWISQSLRIAKVDCLLPAKELSFWLENLGHYRQ